MSSCYRKKRGQNFRGLPTAEPHNESGTVGGGANGLIPFLLAVTFKEIAILMYIQFKRDFARLCGCQQIH